MGYYSRLRDLREDKDLSIRKLAELLHLQRTTYHNYETGKRELPFELAINLAKFYDVSPGNHLKYPILFYILTCSLIWS